MGALWNLPMFFAPSAVRSTNASTAGATLSSNSPTPSSLRTQPVLKEYLPEDALTDKRDWLPYAISLALCFRAPSYMKDEEYVVRGVPQLNLTDGSITVQTEVQEGTSIWFSSRDKEKITTGFDRMATQIEEQLGGEQPKLVFQFECVTSGQLMFREQEKLQLLKRFRQSLDPDVPWVGFYTIGRLVR